MSNRLTLVELLEHSSDCRAFHCSRENECREMKQLIYHSLLCKQVACRVCVEVSSYIITHSNGCTRDCCPVMTCSTLRLHTLDKERKNCKLSSNSQDLAALQNLKQKCKSSCGVRAKVRGTYQCGRCGMPKIRPHKCASETHEQPAMDSDSEIDDGTVDSNKSSLQQAPPLSSGGCNDSNTKINTCTRRVSIDSSARNYPSAIVLTKKTVSDYTHHRPPAVFPSQHLASTDSEDSHESTSTSASYESHQSEGLNRKRAASPDAASHVPSSKRADHNNSGNFSFLHEPASTASLQREAAPYKVLSRHSSYDSNLSEASSTQSDSADAEQGDDNEHSEEPYPYASHTEPPYPPYPPYVHYGMPPPSMLPPGMWMPPPGTDFPIPPGYSRCEAESSGMVPMQDPFGRWMPMPYMAPSQSTAAAYLASFDSLKGNPLVRSASQLRRNRAQREEDSPQITKSAQLNPAGRFPPSQTELRAQTDRAAHPVPRVLPPSDHNYPSEHTMPQHYPLRQAHLHGHEYDPSTFSTSTSATADSLSVQLNHTPLPTHTTTAAAAAALSTVEESAELELDFDAFDFSVNFTPQSEVRRALHNEGNGLSTESDVRGEKVEVYTPQEGNKLFDGLNQELIST